MLTKKAIPANVGKMPKTINIWMKITAVTLTTNLDHGVIPLIRTKDGNTVMFLFVKHANVK